MDAIRHYSIERQNSNIFNACFNAVKFIRAYDIRHGYIIVLAGDLAHGLQRVSISVYAVCEGNFLKVLLSVVNGIVIPFAVFQNLKTMLIVGKCNGTLRPARKFACMIADCIVWEYLNTINCLLKGKTLVAGKCGSGSVAESKV